MSIRLEDLPPKAREQAARKVLESETLASGRDIQEAGHYTRERKGKYRNQKAVRIMEDGTEIKFDSQKEARRFDELFFLQKAGQIRDLRLQVDFTLREAYTTKEGYRVRAIKYRADFTYEEPVEALRGGWIAEPACEPDRNDSAAWRLVVEDVKSEATKTRAYEIKKKLMLDQFNIRIREV